MSRTLELAEHVLGKLAGETEELNLFKDCPSPLDWESLQLRDSLIENKDFEHPMLRWARQFAAADTIVIAAPYWDLMFPAVLKTYIESINVSGVTFYYEHGGPVSLCRAKKLIYVSTAGGPVENNFGFDYIKALAKNFYGIDDVCCVMAEWLDSRSTDLEEAMNITKRRVNEMLT
jgi:FMN-dependent NADH-azoreductase